MVERGIFPFWLSFEQLPKHQSTFFSGKFAKSSSDQVSLLDLFF